MTLQDPSLRFGLLGRPAAWRDGEELDLGPGKQRAVLAVLLLTPNRPVSTSSIVEAVWGDEPPDNGVNVVQKYVAGLRRVLEPDRSPRSPGRLLTLTGAGYALHVPAGGLDAEVFRERLREALAVRDSGDNARAGGLVREALDLWRGTALAGLNGPFFDAARDRLDEERAAALEASAEIGLDLGEHARLVPELIRMVAEFPLREGFRYLLMLALYRSGRQAEALAAYRDAREFFAEEFGSEPGERLQNLHVGILRSDPALAAPSVPDDPPPERGGSGEAPVPVSGGFAPPDPQVVAAAPVVEVRAGPVVSSWPPHPAPAVYPPPAVVPPRRRLPWAVRLVLLLVPLVSFGVATWALFAYFAARRRSLWLGLVALAYLAAAGFFFGGALASNPDETTWWDLPILLTLLAVTLGGSVHLAVLTADPWPGGTAVLDVQQIERRVRREQARSLVAHDPAVARRLRVGRPDLPRTFDDGGLIDVNSAPEHLLASLPELDAHQAKLIVLARTAHGPLASVDDLAVGGILPYAAVHALRETLIAVPPGADADIPDGSVTFR
ncbi:BTAD domain-containing putative transcriptional regulator [Actinomadura spongiicola]|uniref:BTAD domain-containing putative transcriptional regulator n=1 Tax=Actinomadura spongiicola TaxID=2303421 RepID=UPI001313EE02|nr:BTAD domain-containing putative transcriptional regulator [Actinomadura spongiicola]